MISDLIKLFQPVPEYYKKPNETQTQAAKDIAKHIDLANLAETKNTHLIRILTETGNTISSDCDIFPEKRFFRGILLDNLDPQRLALPLANQSSMQRNCTHFLV